MELFDEMEAKGIEPTQVTYSVTISALGNGLQWERALWLLNLMREKGMQVNLITYNAGKKTKQNKTMQRKIRSLSIDGCMKSNECRSSVSICVAEHSCIVLCSSPFSSSSNSPNQ
jgi:hypothetical protein